MEQPPSKSNEVSEDSCNGKDNSLSSKIKEENEKLLYLWQRASFMDTENGIPREMSDSLRLRIALLSSYHTKLRAAGQSSLGTGQLLKEDLWKYGEVMDERDETKGMNNLCGAVEAMLAHRPKPTGPRNWKFGLDADSVRSLPAYKDFQDSLKPVKHQTAEAGARTTPQCPASSCPSHFPPSSSTSSFSTAAPVKPHPPPSMAISTTLTATTLSSASNCGSSSSSSLGVGGVVGRSHGGQPVFPPTSQLGAVAATSTSHQYQGPGKSRAFSVIGGGPGGDEEGGASSRQGQRGSCSKRHKLAVDDCEEVGKSSTETFVTARDEHNKQQQNKFRRGGASASVEYSSSSKKALGTRRGVSSKFVPPARKDEDGFSDGVMDGIQSRVFGGKGRGCGAGGKRQADKARGESTNCLPPELEDNEKLKNIEPKMVELILNEIVDHSAPVQWADIAGLEFAKATINEIIVWPMMRPDIFTGLRGPPKGVLLFGPPGTGKTLIGKCIASQVAATFFSISASSLTSKWIGEGEKMVRALFAVARCYQPAIIFMDEIDSLLTQRNDTEHESSRRIKTEFLVQLDGATTSEADRLLVIGATNRPQEIDEAARRRLVKRLYIPLPEAAARKKIVMNLMKKQPSSLSEEELESIARHSEGYSGADMANLCREAAYGPVREAASSIQYIAASEMREVLYRDFESALEVIRPSVSEKDLNLYVSWNKQFGSGR